MSQGYCPVGFQIEQVVDGSINVIYFHALLMIRQIGSKPYIYSPAQVSIDFNFHYVEYY